MGILEIARTSIGIIGFLFFFGVSFARGEATPSLTQEQFATPPQAYRPIDTWWWDCDYLTRDRLKWQLEDMHSKGVGGTWLYPRYGASQSLSCEPGYWTEGWWEFVEFVLGEHQRLGMVQWANDWIGRLDKNYFQNQLMLERDRNPRLTGHRLAATQKQSTKVGPLVIEVPADEAILSAAAYKIVTAEPLVVDASSRIDLLAQASDHKVTFEAPGADWLAIAITSQSHGLDYLGTEVVKRWIEIYFDQYLHKIGNRLGKQLTAYGPDERFVLTGSILYSDGLRERFRREKGYDPLTDLAAMFVDVGPRTNKLRCEYYDVMVSELEEKLYAPLQKWLHEHGMQQATVATWGRENLLGQVTNYGDFFRMMRHFDIPGNEDSIDNGTNAFIDTKLASSIAHLNGNQRVVVCGYWGTGWGFTQEQNIARTSMNYAFGMNIINTHGGLYALMGARNEFVPPEVHFYQPYWRTWRVFSDYASRLSYALSQGVHRADVAVVYPLSTLHASWHGGKIAFDPPAYRAQASTFSIARAVFYGGGLDFDFVDERSISDASVNKGTIRLGALEFRAVVLPAMSTLPTATLDKLRSFVEAGGTLVVHDDPPTASVEHGRDDEHFRKTWKELLGDYAAGKEPLVERRNNSGGRTLLVRGKDFGGAAAIAAAITPDVRISQPEVIHTHQQLGEDHVYYIVNRSEERRRVDVTLRDRGTPEIWDAFSGRTTPAHRFQLNDDGTILHLTMDPLAGTLIVLKPPRDSVEVRSDNLDSIEEVRPVANGFDVVGTAGSGKELDVAISSGGRAYRGHSPATKLPNSIDLSSPWECEYAPTMDNRWGDYRYPASQEMIGPETSRIKYRAEPSSGDRPDWQRADLADDDWQYVKCTYGPYWQVLGPFDQASDSTALGEQIVASSSEAKLPPELVSNDVSWQPYTYSWKFGADRVDIHQNSIDGVGPVVDDFLAFSRLANKVSVCYLTTNVYSPAQRAWYLHLGDSASKLPRQCWVNGKLILDVGPKSSASVAEVALQEGMNRVVVRLEIPATTTKVARAVRGPIPIPPKFPKNGISSTYAVFQPSEKLTEPPRFMPLSRWFASSSELTYDYRPAADTTVGWFRFAAPPGARRAKLNLQAEAVEAWVNGAQASIVDGVLQIADEEKGSTETASVALRVKHKRGKYEGAAFDAPIAFECTRGKIAIGDWCRAGLPEYSGGVTYIKTVNLTAEQLAHRAILDLGEARTSAEVTVNGQSLGVLLARPLTRDITKALRAGNNEIRVQVLNTLANYMTAQPTAYIYKGQTVSGLLGPVTLRFSANAVVHCVPEK